MRHYTFLYKPVFYIFSLFFATWLVMEVEKIKPSEQKEQAVVKQTGFPDPQKYLQNLCCAYKAGVIDSASLNRKLTYFMQSVSHGRNK